MGRILEGKAICGGIVMGKVSYYRKKEASVRYRMAQDRDVEIARYESAREIAGHQLAKLHERTFAEIGREGAGIFEAQKMILEDEEFGNAVKSLISERFYDAESAVTAAGEKVMTMFADMDDAYLRARALDRKDVCSRLLDILGGSNSDEGWPVQANSTGVTKRPEALIIMADELTPGETVKFDKRCLGGIVTKYGSADSHTAILARIMNIPAVTDIDITGEMDGKMVIVDGFAGKLIVEPDAEMLDFYQMRMKEEERKKESRA